MRRKIFKKFSSGLDYLTVRANKEAEFWKILESPKEMGDEVNAEGLPFKWKFEKEFTEFLVMRMKDMNGNNLGQVKMVTNPTNQRKNIFDEIELQGTFFMAYPQYLFKVLDLFGIDIHKTRLPARIDYRFDVYSSSTNIGKMFVDHGKPVRLHRKKKCLTWGMIKTDRIEMVFYDKILDIRENEEKLGLVDVNGEKPYEKYLQCKNDITRLEYRKNSRALRETGRTLAEELMWVKNDAMEYMAKLGIYVKDDVETARTYKKQEDMRISREAEIVGRSVGLAETYIHKADLHGANEKVIRMLYDRYGTELIRKLQDVHFERARFAEEIFAESKNENVWQTI